MRIRSKQNFSCFVVLQIFTLFVLYQCMQLESSDSRIMPLCICGMLFFLNLCGMVQEIRSSICELPDEDQKAKSPVSVKICLGYLFGFAFAVWLIGFYIASPIFVAAYVRINGGSWKSSLLTGCLAGVFLYLIFPVCLQVDMYPGILLFNL